MGKLKNGFDNVGGILDIANSAYNTAEKGTETFNRIKAGEISKNSNEIENIEKKTRQMKIKFYFLWTVMIVVAVFIFLFF